MIVVDHVVCVNECRKIAASAFYGGSCTPLVVTSLLVGVVPPSSRIWLLGIQEGGNLLFSLFSKGHFSIRTVVFMGYSTK